MTLESLDLFSGIGGFALGLKRAGIKTREFCEIDKDACKVLRKHWPGVGILEDIHKVNGYEFYDIDVLCGGFPCQDISVAGKQKGLIDEVSDERTRSGLWFEYKRIIKEARPRWVIIENVRNLLSNGMMTVLKDLDSIGYNCEWQIISARDVGACHLRERVWIVAWPQ